MLLEVLLDARELAAPEPLEQATAILHRLEPGQYLRMLHRRVPYPLFDFCRQMSLAYHVSESESSPCEVIIYFPVDEQLLREDAVL